MQPYFEALSDLGTNGTLTFLENTSHLQAPSRCAVSTNVVVSQVQNQSTVSASICPGQSQNLAPQHDSDIFQCGRCKQQFNMLDLFLQHKNNPCVPNRQPVCQSGGKMLNTGIQPVNIISSMPCPGIYGAPTVINNQGNSGQPVNNMTNCMTSHHQNMQPDPNQLQIHPQTSGNSITTVPLQRIVLPDEMLLHTESHHVTSMPNEPMSNHPGMGEDDVSSGNNLISSLLQQIPPFEPSQQMMQSHASPQQPNHVLHQRNEECPAMLQMTPALVQNNHSVVMKSQEKSMDLALPSLYTRNVEQDSITISQTSSVAATRSLEPGPIGQRSGARCDDPKKKFQCDYCKKPFAKNFDLEQHKRSHTGEKPFQCIVCGRAFAQKSNVKKHMVSHKVWLKGKSSFYQPFSKERDDNNADSTAGDEVVSFVCEYCGKGFSSYNKRKSHMKVHKDQQVYKCLKEECASTFRDLDEFVEHVKSHESGMTYRCHQCHKVFKTLHDLGVHQYQVHLNSKKKSIHTKMYACALCPSKFSHPTALREHMTSDPHKHICGICDATFTCERYLRKHYLLQHKGQNTRSATCNICGKSLRSVYYLRLHMYIHTKELPYHCTKCDAAFNRKDKVKRHMLTHDSVKRFKCPLKSVLGCNKEFNRADKLKEHIISHSGVKKKPFTCSYCPKTYSRHSSKVNHEKTHKLEHFCSVCLKSFSSQSDLKSHKCSKTSATTKSRRGCARSEKELPDVSSTSDVMQEKSSEEKELDGEDPPVFTDLWCRTSSASSETNTDGTKEIDSTNIETT